MRHRTPQPSTTSSPRRVRAGDGARAPQRVAGTDAHVVVDARLRADPRLHVRTGRAVVSHPLHDHAEHQVGLVDGGAIEYFVGGARHEAAPGTVVSIEGAVPHYARSRVSGGADFVLAFIAPALLDEVTDAIGAARRPGFPAVVSTDPALAAALRTLGAAVRDRASALAQDVAAIAALNAIGQLRTRGDGHPGARHGGSVGERAAVRRALEYLHAHATTEVSLDALARAAHLSKYRLVRAFGAQVGQPPHAYQLHLRVSHAHRLLARGMPASQAALATGFSDHSHLTRTFRRTLGITPREAVRGGRAIPVRHRGDRATSF